MSTSFPGRRPSVLTWVCSHRPLGGIQPYVAIEAHQRNLVRRPPYLLYPGNDLDESRAQSHKPLKRPVFVSRT